MSRGSGVLWVVGCWVALCAAHLGLTARDLERPGLYYDEVVQAGTARDFVEGGARGLHIPGAESVSVAGRPFPWMTQGYMGALKSQLLIPTLALFGPSVAALRLTTLSWGLVGLLLAMLLAHQLLGLPVALLAGALLAFDPSFVFAIRHDWGSFALGLLLRCAALCLVGLSWRRRRSAPLVAAGLLLGLGIYNKIDFALFLCASGLAVLLSWPREIAVAWRELRGGSAVALGLVGLGALPMAGFALQGREIGAAAAELTDLPGKLAALWSTLDGSSFYRLLASGGRFDRMLDVPDAPAGPLAVAFVVALPLCAAGIRRRAVVFVLATGLLTLAGVLVTPGLDRLHHFLNAAPFPHLAVATAVWSVARSRRAPAALLACALAAANVGVCLETFDLIERTGGRGAWSDTVTRYVRGLGGDRLVVSLDWGFHEQVLFLGNAPAVEPFWAIPWFVEHQGAWVLDGGPENLYLTYDWRYGTFVYGALFLDAVRKLPLGVAVVEPHLDRAGEVAFASVVIPRPHRLVFRERFEIQLR